MEAFNYNLISSTFKIKYKSIIPQVIEALDEIFITYPTILLMNNREKDAIMALDKAEQICEYFKKHYESKGDNLNMVHSLDSLAKINLMKVGLDIKNNIIFNIEN